MATSSPLAAGSTIVRFRPSPLFSSAALRRRKKQTRNIASVATSLGPAGIKADGGLEELDSRCVSLPSGLPGGGVT